MLDLAQVTTAKRARLERKQGVVERGLIYFIEAAIIES
jgi:hypothetical protein